MLFLFWISIATILFVYLGYPIALKLMSKRSNTIDHDEAQPSVTLVISAYNEANVIGDKIRNALASEYPAELLDVIVVSDASDDGTDEIVQKYKTDRVMLLRMERRSGKSLGLNEAVSRVERDIVLFTDANAMFEPKAIARLVEHFSDTSVGVVVGQQRYHHPGDSKPLEEGVYWKYESAIKVLESNAGSLVGGDGAIMAIRKELFTELCEDDLSDYLIPLTISMRGYRNVYEPDARCFEEAAESYGKEFQRKVRIVNRAWRATMNNKAVLNPFRFKRLSFCVWSHKVLRWLVGVFLFSTLVSNLLIFEQSVFYVFCLALQTSLYALVLIGYLRRQVPLPSVIGIPYYFVLVNIAAIFGIIQHYQGKRYATWTTAREKQS